MTICSCIWCVKLLQYLQVVGYWVGLEVIMKIKRFREQVTRLGYVFILLCLLASNSVSIKTAKAQATTVDVQPSLGSNIVLNGNFETPDVTAYTFDTYYAGRTFGNWYVESGSVDHISERYWQAADGRQSVDLGGNSDGAISQYLITTPLHSYLLIFALSGNPETGICTYMGPIKRMEIWWGSTLVDTLAFDTTGHSNWSMGWGYHQYKITATDAITKLMFKSLNSNCHGPVLDMVSVQSDSGGEIPALEIPLKVPTGKRFSDVALGNYRNLGGWVNSWFDHDTPDYKNDQKLRSWNGTSLEDKGCTLGFNCYDGHNGIDFQRQSHKDENGKTVYDDDIFAAAPGIVVDLCEYTDLKPCKDSETGLNKRGEAYGKWILIRHGQPGNYGNYATFYGHLDSINVTVGQEITDIKNTPIGRMGTTGTGSTGVHLHFGVYYDANGNEKWEEHYGYKDKMGVWQPAYTEAVDPYGWFGTTPDPWWNKSLYLWKFPLQDKQLVDETGAVLITPSGKGKITVQPGVIITPITLELWDASMPILPFSGFGAVGHPVWLRVLESQAGTTNNIPLGFSSLSINATSSELPQSVSINIRYGSDDTKHLNTNLFGIYWLDESSDSWVGLPTTINTNLKETNAQTTNLGYFSLQAPLLCPTDTQEPNDRYDGSNVVQTNGTPVNNLFDIAQDEDWFQFDAVIGKTYTLNTTNLSAGVDTIVEIYDTDGVTLLALDDNSGDGNASSLTWRAPGSGVYFVRVRQGSGSAYGCNASYVLNISTVLTLIWSDEFNGSSVDSNNWNFDVGNGVSGWGNGELEYYTNGANTSVENGELIIQARKENMNGYQYTSTRMTTKGKEEFKYGKVEARIKLPSGQGLWPAFWMLGSNFPSTPWPKSGEIDIMEHKNVDNFINGAVHWYDDINNHGADYSCPPSGGPIPNIDVTQYHLYDIEWDSSYIRWHVDGNLYCEIYIQDNTGSTEEFHQPFFILLNIAVGGNFPGAPNGTTTFPANMYVDYVRVYQDKLRAPALISPSNGYATEDTTINFTWNSVMSGNTYQIQIDDSAQFTDPLVRDHTGNPGELSYTTTLPPNATYYWHVRALTDHDEPGEWSGDRHFRIRPVPPSLLDPAGCERVTALRPVFDWNDVSDAELYDIEISGNTNFTPSVMIDFSSISAYTPRKDLPPGTTMYWRARAISPGGPSIWSSTECFIAPNPPGIPLLISPNPDAMTMDYRPLFKWNAVLLPRNTEFDHYQIQISPDEVFSTLVVNEDLPGISTRMFTPAVHLAVDTKYYWRMRVFDADHEYSSWSEVRSFTTPRLLQDDRPHALSIDPALPLPELLSPLNGKNVNASQPILDWADVPGARSFIVQVSTDPTFATSTFVVSATTVESRYDFIDDSPVGVTLYWRVCTVHGDQVSTWSPTFKFNIQ